MMVNWLAAGRRRMRGLWLKLDRWLPLEYQAIAQTIHPAIHLGGSKEAVGNSSPTWRLRRYGATNPSQKRK